MRASALSSASTQYEAYSRTDTPYTAYSSSGINLADHADEGSSSSSSSSSPPSVRPSFLRRSQMTDAEYDALSPAEKTTVLDDGPFNRTTRCLKDT